MTTVSPHVLALDGPDVVMGSGTIMPAPADPAEPDTVLDRLAAALGDNGQVFLTGSQPAWNAIVAGKQIGEWKITGGPSWYTAMRHPIRLRIGVIPEIKALNDPMMSNSLIDTVIRHQVFARLLGVPFYADGGTTAVLLLDATVRVRGRQPLRKWENKDAPAVHEAPWPGAGGWEPQPEYHAAVTLDRNAQYLSAVNGCYLPLDGLEHTGAVQWDPAASGYWLISVPDNPEPRLPHPAGKGITAGPRWCAGPTVALLAELGTRIQVADSWTCPRDRCRRAMDPWYARLRDARARLLDNPDTDSAAILAAVKDCYSRGISHLDRSTDRRWYRPDWRATLFAAARVSMWRALHRAGREYKLWPVAIASDSVTYSDTEAPKAFKIGSRMGEWKVRP